MVLILIWLIYLIVGFAIGLCFGFILNGVFRVMLLLLFGYHDSGPSWIASGSHVLYLFSILSCVVIVQKLFYDKYLRK